jgi:hypothetical protein
MTVYLPALENTLTAPYSPLDFVKDVSIIILKWGVYYKPLNYSRGFSSNAAAAKISLSGFGLFILNFEVLELLL